VAPVRIEAGGVLMREGEPGDRYYVIASGRVDVTRDGRHLRTCGPGEGVGEIALLRQIPRTATVIAVEPTELLAVDPGVFVSAVTDDPHSAAAAKRVVGERLGAVAN
jgi:CRP-like cAMP-binding protein